MGPESYTNKFAFRPFLNLKLEIKILDEIKKVYPKQTHRGSSS